MEAKIQKQIIDYFSFFEEFYNSSKTYLKDCQNCAASVNKLIVRCKNIHEAEVANSPLDQFEGLRSKICSSLHNLISEDIEEIKTKLSTLEELFEKLCHKHRVLLESCKELDLKSESPLIKGTPLQPSLSHLIEFADDTISFGGELCAQIQTSLSVLEFKGLNTPAFPDNFKLLPNWQHRIPEILSYTSFCSENQI